MANRTNRQKAIVRRRIFIALCAIVLAAAVAIISIAVNFVFKAFKTPEDSQSNSSLISSSQESENENKEPYVVSKATVINTGDIMLHSTVLDGAKTSGGGYDFSAFFKESESYFKNADLAVANLEVTLGGSESGAFSGYPAFNSPDELLTTIKQSGISFLQTANNHCYDTGLYGLKRTVQKLKEAGIDYNGTRESADEATYTVKDVNGVKIGMVTYTYENAGSTAGRKSINGNIVASEANALINSFDYNKLDSFYSEAQNVISSMKNDGADAIVFYMHWGEEYQLSPNTWQKTIAQKLCNFGVDVIVGGHPHVVQPIELLHSEDGQSTSVCIYSLGNAISNQRKELLSPECTTGHTEDGMLFYFSFDKYSDGETVLSGVDIIPTWVDKYSGGSGYQYTMYPLESAEAAESYSLSANTAAQAKASFERTKAQIATGLKECQTALGCEVRFD